jgi:tripeptide aminopeptidase
VTATALHPASQQERERLVADFVRLCEIESPSGRERAMADAVTAELRAARLDVEEDDTAVDTGSDAGNLLARIPGPEGARAVLLCAHIDTVPLDAPVEVVRENGVLTNRHEAILGADNKAAVATLLGAARRLVRAGPPVEVELLFTTSEERALRGAKAFDKGRLRSEFGFVFDHASPIGEVIVASPTYYRLEARFRGQAAHAGIRPEAGRNAIAAASRAVAAMRIGRLDDETTANVGRIEGGTARNIVPEWCTVAAEARSHDDGKLADLVQEMLDAFAFAASVEECEVETEVETSYRGYRFRRDSQAVSLAAQALSRAGYQPSYALSGGGADANVFNERGLACVNLANGMAQIHTPDEHIAVADLDGMVEVTLALIDVARQGAA